MYLGELADAILGTLVPAVNDVDAVGHRVLDVLRHEAPKATEVRRNGGNAHHSALGRGVAVARRQVLAFEGRDINICIRKNKVQL